MYCNVVCIRYSPKFDLPIIETMVQSRGRMSLMCHRCGEVGHKAMACPTASLSAGDSFNVATSSSQHPNRSHYSGFRHDLRPLDQVTCFKVSVVYADAVISEIDRNVINCFNVFVMTRF